MSNAVLQMPVDNRASPPPHEPPSVEKWVGVKELANHLGFSYANTARMVRDGRIPAGKPFQCGKKTYWRFKLSIVDAALTAVSGNSQGSAQ